MSVHPATVLSRVPGWERADIERLDGGLMNRSYLVSEAGRRAVLKIDEVANDPPRNDRTFEARLQAAACDAGIAGRVLYCDRVCLLTEYVEGDVWSRSQLANDANLHDLGHALRSLHALPLCGRAFCAAEAARRYAREIDGQASRVRESLATVESVDTPVEWAMCHNDLVAANIVQTPALKFLDWEYACDNDPMFDLATVIAHHRLDERQADVLLSAYFGGEWRQVGERLQQQIKLYEALLWLWQAATKISPGVS